MSAKAILSASVSAPPVYVEDVFSTFLYTGNGSTQTITNGIDLAGKGGLTWIKGRSGATGHRFTDTTRGATKSLESNSTAAEATESTGLTSFSSTGFVIGADADYNTSAATYCSWTFRKAAKFFDVVTYTGTGSDLTLSHSLGGQVGVIIIKRTDSTGDWWFYHRSIPNFSLKLNSTASQVNQGGLDATATTFTLYDTANVNISGATYVAYLFAHDAGGFGTAGTDSVVSCGSFTPDGSGNATVTLGWEPQWVLYKRSAVAAENWKLVDNMRGFVVGAGNDAYIFPNTSGAENATTGISPFSTGFTIAGEAPSSAYIYIAIRRGPMKTPTVGTEVFSATTYTGNATANTTRTTSILTDLLISTSRNETVRKVFFDRLRGAAKRLASSETSAEVSQSSTSIGVSNFDRMNGYVAGADQDDGAVNYNTWTYVNWSFRRAPGFFDVVAYTGTFSVLNVSHNLTVAPQLMIIKQRSAVRNWIVYSAGVAAPATSILRLNTTDAVITGVTNHWNSTAPTSSVFTVANDTDVNDSGGTYIAYLFATAPGVSKVFNFTGTGTTLQINCGFTSGARLVLIKRTDSTGDWYIWDSARGIISGNDSYLLLNSTAAEVTNTDYIDPYSAGFEISSTAPAAINANGGSYIGLAIA